MGLDFSEVTTFNLDEYIGMSPDNPQSYHYFMQENFFRHINIRPENVFLPNGMAEDMVAEGERYEQLIESRGGIDLQVLGIGQNAHIGFNEPDLKFAATTHKVELDEETIQANSQGRLRGCYSGGSGFYLAVAPGCGGYRGQGGGCFAAAHYPRCQYNL